jgi:serine/threonine protein kinase
MVNQRGELKVSDFGIARSLIDSVSRLTMEQGRSGTLVYMSPQQLASERGTHLDDIYSLGATLYDLLTSKPPFHSGNIDRQIHERVAPSMTERRKEFDIEPALVPQVWEDAVAACLAKDLSRRPQSAAEVAQRLQLAPEQTRAITNVPAKSSSRKVLLGAGVAALIFLTLAGWYFGILKRHTKPVAVVAKPPQAQAAAIPEKSIAVLPLENLSDEKENAYFADGIQDELLSRQDQGPESDQSHFGHAVQERHHAQSQRNRAATGRRPCGGRQRPPGWEPRSRFGATDRRAN